MESPIKTLSTTKMPYALDRNLEVFLNIKDNKDNIAPSSLFKLAARKNEKREFLFVSKVIGKHLPINPYALEIAGALLARLWVEEREGTLNVDKEILVQALHYLGVVNTGEFNLEQIKNALEIVNSPLKLKNSTLFIGFAETATGIAHSVFNSFSDAALIHTSRENITSITAAILFREEHSHAVEHLLYPENPDIFSKYEDIVLIDDELTTGNSALNLIKNLPGKSFGIISILDWRNEDNLKVFEDIHSTGDRKIRTCSLIQGTVECQRKGDSNKEDPITMFSDAQLGSYKEICLEPMENIDGFLKVSGRFGMDSKEQRYLEAFVTRSGARLKDLRTEGSCLCLGTGEYIYIPCRISSKMGDNVYFQSTTRSPIYARDSVNHGFDYAINSKVQFKSPSGDDVMNYLYNIPQNFYNQVFFFTEKPLKEEKKKELSRIFSFYGINEQIFVYNT